MITTDAIHISDASGHRACTSQIAFDHIYLGGTAVYIGACNSTTITVAGSIIQLLGEQLQLYRVRLTSGSQLNDAYGTPIIQDGKFMVSSCSSNLDFITATANSIYIGWELDNICGSNNVLIGKDNQGAESDSILIGRHNHTNNSKAIIIGACNTTKNPTADLYDTNVIIGVGNTIRTGSSICIGVENTPDSRSIVIGSNIHTICGSIAIGDNIKTTTDNSTLFKPGNSETSIIGFNHTRATEALIVFKAASNNDSPIQTACISLSRLEQLAANASQLLALIGK